MLIKLSNLLTGIDTNHSLNRLTIDLIQSLASLDSIIYYEFLAPTISGYSGRQRLVSSTILDAAVKEWTALCNVRRQGHINDLIHQLRSDLVHLPPRMTLENVHSLAGDPMGVASLLSEECSIPETLIDMLLNVQSSLSDQIKQEEEQNILLDDQLEESLTIFHRLTSNGSTRMASTNIIEALLKRMALLFATDRNKNYNANPAGLAKIFIPVALDILAQLVQTKAGCIVLGKATSLQVLFSFLEFADNKGTVFHSQVPIVVSILACALYKSSSNKHASKTDWHSIKNVIHATHALNAPIADTTRDRNVIKSYHKPIPFPATVSILAKNKMLHLATNATKISNKINALWCHLSHFNATKHEHTDSVVDENVRLMFETKAWSKKQIDIPHWLIQYLMQVTLDLVLVVTLCSVAVLRCCGVAVLPCCRVAVLRCCGVAVVRS